MPNRPTSFDPQAETYDQRAGLPEAHCQVIAQAVRQLAAATPGDLIVEVGAGSGLLGAWLARPPLRYVGIDRSRRMLTVFHKRVSSASQRTLLLQADGDAPWPLADAAVRVIFSSRALHWLDPAHVVYETCRVARRDGASLIIGRIRRAADSLSTTMQQAMRRLLGQHGFSIRAGEAHQRHLLTTFQRRGATVMKPVDVVRWTVKRTPGQSIEDWQSKPGLAGLDVPSETKDAILDELRRWAQTTFGDLRRTVASEETYVLQGIHL